MHVSMLVVVTANGFDASTHNGVKTMISMQFIRKGLLDIEYGATLTDLFNQRHISDYEAYIEEVEKLAYNNRS